MPRTAEVPLAEPVDRTRLAAEIARCERVAVVDSLEVYDFHGDTAPTVMREIGRIREREYRAVGAGRNLPVDLDRYDTAPHRYRQIVVWDPAARELAAMYRFAVARDALEHLGRDGLRTSTLFRCTPRFRDTVLLHAVELGRSVVNSKAAAALRGLTAVWFGLGAVITRSPSIQYCFGNVTIPAVMPPAAVGDLLTMLRIVCPPADPLAPGDLTAIEPLKAPSHTDSRARNNAYTPGDHRGALKILRARLADYGTAVPSILVSYLKRSTRLWAFETARDTDFGGALETAIVVPVVNLTNQTKRRFLFNRENAINTNKSKAEEQAMSETPYYEGFTERWTPKTDELAEQHDMASILIMKSTPTHMVTAASGGSARTTYTPGGAGPKSVIEGNHKLYCEQVINTDASLLVPDAASDPEWRGNEDLVKFGFGFYLGVPLHDKSGVPVGTVCALNPSQPADPQALAGLRGSLEGLAREVEADIASRPPAKST